MDDGDQNRLLKTVTAGEHEPCLPALTHLYLLDSVSDLDCILEWNLVASVAMVQTIDFPVESGFMFEFA